MLLLALSLLVSPARAERMPADYEQELFSAAATRVEQLSAAGRTDEAVALGRRIERRIGPSSLVSYEIGYALNRQGDRDGALQAYDRALTLDPDLATARYDRGELLLLEGRDADARADFEAAARLRPDHWAVHFRLAELDARAGDARGFEDHLVEAMRQGFDFRTVVRDPQWRSWYRDPSLGPVISRLVVVYSDEKLLDILGETP